MSLIACSCLLFGCEKKVNITNAWLAAEIGLDELKQRVVGDSRIYDDALSDDLQFFRTLPMDRFVVDNISDFVVVDATHRRATYAAKLDHWPLEIDVQIRRLTHGWSITDFLNRQALRNSLRLLSDSGLPRLSSGQSWAGGLMGRDDQGRPNSAVLICADGDSISIDGRPFRSYTEAQALKLIKKEITARRRASTKAFATYRPHTALGLSSHAPMSLLHKLVSWSTQAGAESIQLLARSKNGPIWLPLAVIEIAEGDHSNWHLSLSSEALHLRDGTHSKGAKIGGSLKQVRPLLNALKIGQSRGAMHKGVIIESQSTMEYRAFLDWMALVHRQRPDLRIGLAGSTR